MLQQIVSCHTYTGTKVDKYRLRNASTTNLLSNLSSRMQQADLWFYYTLDNIYEYHQHAGFAMCLLSMVLFIFCIFSSTIHQCLYLYSLYFRCNKL